MRCQASLPLLAAFVSAALTTLPCRADEISGVVLDLDGKPLPGAEVRLEVGWAHYVLTPDFDRWYAVETRTARAGDDGRFTFSDLPPGVVGTAFVKTGDAIGVARGSKQLEVRLGPPGSLKGRVLGKRQDIKNLRIWVRGGAGLGSAEGTVDKKTGNYEVKGLAPGPARAYVKLDNWDLAIRDVVIEAGKKKSVKAVKLRGKFLPGPDPMVDCVKARLVDADQKPVPAVQLVWSSRWMDGGMNSDQDGIVKLAGGGVAIGGPPYLLRIGSLRGKELSYSGALVKIRKGTAIVQLTPLRAIRGTLKRGGEAVERYRLFVVGAGKRPRVYTGSVESGNFTVHVPDKTCRFVIGTADGTLHEQLLVTPGTPLEITLK